MVRKFTLLLFVLFAATGVLFSQTTSIKMVPFGVSPAMVAERAIADSALFKYTYSGLQNVGLGTRVYLKVTGVGMNLVNPTMGTVSIPATSRGASTIFGPKKKVDDATYIFTFTPDVLGTFKIKVTDGAYTAELTFNSAKYLGVSNKGTSGVDCQSCHPSFYTKWQTTGHSNFFERAINGQVSPYYSASSMASHTTGYDNNPSALNDGFDDFSFVFPTTLQAGNYASLTTAYPDAMKRANIQCEACHGPGSGHLGGVTNSRMQASWDEAVCNKCHYSNHYAFQGEQFAVSKHANPVDESGRADCAKCHQGKGFAQVTSGMSTSDPYFDLGYSNIGCSGCHDPHNKTNIHQLRTVTATATDNTTPITKGGTGRLCMNCHKARTAATDTYVSAATFSRFGPHHTPSSNVFLGTNFFTWGMTPPQTKHADLLTNGCVDCHMAASDLGANERPKLMGNHTFSMNSPEGESNMKACATCHGYSLGAKFSDVRFYYSGIGDLDRDGTTEGFMAEVEGYCNLIFARLPVGTPANAAIMSTRPTASWTLTEKQVLFNLYMVLEDKSMGMHNPKLVAWVLDQSYKKVGGTPVGVTSETKETPKEFALFQNYPNPFNPTTNIKFSLPKESKVKLTIYDAIGKEITVLVDGQLNAGSHTVQWNATNFASGVYFFRIEADNFKMTNKMLLMK